MSGLEVFLGNGDVKDAFHRFRLRRDFALWFRVGQASAHELRITGQTVDGTLLHKGSQVDFVWTSLPLGFSWALFLCQHIIQDNATRSLAGQHSLLMQDRAPPAVFRLSKDSVAESSCARARYVDHLGVAGCEKREVEEGLDLVAQALEDTGLKTHKISVDSATAAPLGVLFNGRNHYTALSPRRCWKVVQAGRYALSRRAMPGWAWEILLGHLILCGLVCRDVLSAFHRIYAFIRKHYNKRVPLCPVPGTSCDTSWAQ